MPGCTAGSNVQARRKEVNKVATDLVRTLLDGTTMPMIPLTAVGAAGTMIEPGQTKRARCVRFP
jgi:hypothetical protein